MKRTREEQLEHLRKASDAFHADGRHPSSCAAYEAHYGRRCPCEDAADRELRTEEKAGPYDDLTEAQLAREVGRRADIEAAAIREQEAARKPRRKPNRRP